MLVLTRAIGERLVIGNGEVCIHVLEIRGNQVRIGIDAPRHIPVHREEVYRRIINKENLDVKVEEEETV
jgi:carbon storage regulator